jgi:hypothetical protein
VDSVNWYKALSVHSTDVILITMVILLSVVLSTFVLYMISSERRVRLSKSTRSAAVRFNADTTAARKSDDAEEVHVTEVQTSHPDESSAPALPASYHGLQLRPIEIEFLHYCLSAQGSSQAVEAFDNGQLELLEVLHLLLEANAEKKSAGRDAEGRSDTDGASASAPLSPATPTSPFDELVGSRPVEIVGMDDVVESGELLDSVYDSFDLTSISSSRSGCQRDVNLLRDQISSRIRSELEGFLSQDLSRTILFPASLADTSTRRTWRALFR